MAQTATLTRTVWQDCSICHDEDATELWHLAIPLVESFDSYVGPLCSGINRGAVEGLLASDPGLTACMVEL